MFNVLYKKKNFKSPLGVWPPPKVDHQYAMYIWWSTNKLNKNKKKNYLERNATHTHTTLTERQREIILMNNFYKGDCISTSGIHPDTHTHAHNKTNTKEEGSFNNWKKKKLFKKWKPIGNESAVVLLLNKCIWVRYATHIEYWTLFAESVVEKYAAEYVAIINWDTARPCTLWCKDTARGHPACTTIGVKSQFA